MNRVKLARRASKQLDNDIKYSTKEVDKILNTFFQVVIEALHEGHSVAIPQFGKFVMKKRESVEGLNRHTGEKVMAKRPNSVTFIPYKNLLEGDSL